MEIIQTAQSILSHFNEVYGTRYKSVRSITSRGKTSREPSLLEYWLEEYSIDEIKEAITNSHTDPWWGERLTPTILFRKKNPNGEPVDYIGKFLNLDKKITQAASQDLSPCTNLDLYNISKELEIGYQNVRLKHKYILELVESGYFQEKYSYYTSVKQALEKWLKNDIAKGQIPHWSETEKLDVERWHPIQIKMRELLK